MLRPNARRILSARRLWSHDILFSGSNVNLFVRSLSTSNGQFHFAPRRNLSSTETFSPRHYWRSAGRNVICNATLGGAIVNRGSNPLLMSHSWTSTRQMSSSSASDDPISTNLPSFGSSPITPEVESAGNEVVANADAITPFVATWWPSDQCLLFLNYVHEITGLPYALTIGATTLAFRLLLFPVFVKGQRNSSRMAHLQPELAALKSKVDAIPNPDVQTQQRFMAETRALFKKYDCNPVASLVAPLASAPVFISMFFALKNAPEHFPHLLSTGGVFWFPDLTAPDPYAIMPLFSAATFLGMTELGKEQMMAQDPARGRVMTNAFRAMAIVMVPLTMDFNSAVFVYWSVNNTFSFFQTALFRQDAVKKAFGIWDPPKPVPGQESRSILDDIKKMVEKKQEETNALAAERIREHNEIVERQKKVKKALMEKEKMSRRPK
mmetsp:Transcript_17521/g.35693  ORF Transcript_17521/g.35693 Transcript_17521/m.35693 type:complete len:438 (-) Transcript_17521:44-1357(-)